MRVDNFNFQTYGNEDFERLLDQKRALNGLSVFMLLSKCLEKADKSGDGIISESELEIFKSKNTSDILKEVQGEISGYTLDVDDETLLDLMDTVKGLIVRNNKINEDVENLKGMSKDEFVKTAQEKALSAQLTTFEDLMGLDDEILEDEAELSEYEEIEVKEPEGDNPDDEILSTTEEIEEENDSDTFWQLIYADGAEDIFDKIDTDGDGILSEQELIDISGADDNGLNLSMTDLSKVFSFGYYDDIETESTKPETTEQETETSTEKPETEQTQQETEVQKPESSGSSGSSGSTYAPSPSSYNGNNNTQQPVEQKQRTEADIEAEIQQQEQNKVTLKQKAQQDIQTQETLINNLLSQSDLSEAFKQDYDSENTRLQGLIDEKDTEITVQKNLISDATAKIASYTTAMSDIGTQISTMEAQKAKLNSVDNTDLISEYNTKIGNLKTQKEALQSKIDAQNTVISDANTQVSSLEEAKSALETEKNNILDTLADKYKTEKTKVEAIKTQIETYKTEITNIKTKLEGDLATVDANIQTLKNEKANLVQKAETDRIIEENSVLPNNSPYAMTSDPSTFDWTTIGYNAQTGKQIADGVYSYANGRTGNHNCLGGVKKGFNIAFGTNPFKDIHEGWMAAGVLENDPNYREVTGLTIDQLKYLPAGTVVSWSNSSTGSSPASKYGHCSVSLGNGYEASDHVCKQYRHVGNNGTPRVFIPISGPSAYKA